MNKYAGHEWVENSLKVSNMSDLGKDVADLLGYLFAGIYHIERDVRRVNWSNEHHIELLIYGRSGNLATFDFSYLTNLVFLAHRMAIRVEITCASPQYLRLLFHRRGRRGDYSKRHPTIRQALEWFEENCYIPEVE